MSKKLKKKVIEPNEAKLKELILYISELSEGDEKFGSVKLNKLLFFSDFLAYQLNGQSITGYMYEVKPGGPMVKDFYEIRDMLKELGEIAVREKNYRGYPQHRTLALRSADVTKFTPEEMAIIARVLQEHRDMTASQISAKSHDFLGWQVVNMGEEIPYETSLVSARDLTSEEWEFPMDLKVDVPDLVEASVE